MMRKQKNSAPLRSSMCFHAERNNEQEYESTWKVKLEHRRAPQKYERHQSDSLHRILNIEDVLIRSKFSENTIHPVYWTSVLTSRTSYFQCSRYWASEGHIVHYVSRFKQKHLPPVLQGVRPTNSDECTYREFMKITFVYVRASEPQPLPIVDHRSAHNPDSILEPRQRRETSWTTWPIYVNSLDFLEP